MIIKNKHGFCSIIGLLIVCIILMILYAIVAKKYFGEGTSYKDEITEQNTMSSPIVDPKAQMSVLESTTKQIRELEKQQQQRADSYLDKFDEKNY